MPNKRSVERVVGSLFIVATVASSAGFIVLDSVLDDTDVIGSVADNDYQVMLGAFLLLVNAVAVVAIPVLLYPVFREHDHILARLYPASRIVESAVLVIGVVGLLSIVTLSEDAAVASANAGSYAVAADALLAVYDWGVLLGIMLFFSLAGLILNLILYEARLVPRWLSVWGLIGVALLLIEGAFEAFDAENLGLMSLPFAFQEMVFAVWLIVRGFELSTDPTSVDVPEDVLISAR